jgi:hypothetical protein
MKLNKMSQIAEYKGYDVEIEEERILTEIINFNDKDTGLPRQSEISTQRMAFNKEDSDDDIYIKVPVAKGSAPLRKGLYKIETNGLLAVVKYQRLGISPNILYARQALPFYPATEPSHLPYKGYDLKIADERTTYRKTAKDYEIYTQNALINYCNLKNDVRCVIPLVLGSQAYPIGFYRFYTNALISNNEYGGLSLDDNYMRGYLPFPIYRVIKLDDGSFVPDFDFLASRPVFEQTGSEQLNSEQLSSEKKGSGFRTA